LLIVSTHPDDEVLGAGGLIRTWSEQGHRVTVLSVTDGEAAHPGWQGLDIVRRRELERALATLCSRPIATVRLALPDGGVWGTATQLIDALRDLSRSRPTLIAPYERDGHPDHEAVAAACLAVADDLGLPIARYPIWAWHHALPADFAPKRWGKFLLDSGAQAAKCAAMACFASQFDSREGREPIVPSHVLEYFKRDHEAFLL
jgi:LmbE family N-acetylglucosaminyl deacetylase